MSRIDGNETVEKFNTDKENEMDKMREILTSIASEMQRFNDSTFESDSDVGIPSLREKQNVFGELLKCKSKIKSKRVCIKKLRKNLETACSIAKIVATAKDKETGCLKQYTSPAQTECTDIINKFQNNNIVITSLTKENTMLSNKLDNVANFIRLGYEELQKIRQEPPNEKSIFEQLRKLIICCGQYYADYCNEHEECLSLKQKNSFLTNKSQILENTINALSQQLENLRYHNSRLQKENKLLKDKIKRSRENELEVAVSEIRIKSDLKDTFSDESIESEHYRESTENKYELDCDNKFDLSPHLTIVKKLLRCQDALLKDLKCLSDEFLNNN